MGFGDRTCLLQNAQSGSGQKEGSCLIPVGIDVAKRRHEACLMNAEGQEIGRPLRFPHSLAGVATFIDSLRRLEQPVSIALEATGHYWLALHERPTLEGFRVQIVNPLQTDAYRRTTVRNPASQRDSGGMELPCWGRPRTSSSSWKRSSHCRAVAAAGNVYPTSTRSP